MRILQTSTRCQLFAFDLFHKPFQSRHRTRFTSVVVFIKFKHPQELFHYALGGEWVVGALSVGKRSEVRLGMKNSRRNNDRMNSSFQLVVREYNEFVRQFIR